jgi:PAS domain S-box-containing protein
MKTENNDAMQTATTSPVTPRQMASSEKNHRILVVDDNEAIHDDFRKILGADASAASFQEEAEGFFGKSERNVERAVFEMDFAVQGAEALELVEAAVAAGRRYAVAFLDVRMPPGWDGLETTVKLWEADPDLQIVICTAYSDYSWDQMMDMIGTPERMLILKKPFDAIEVLQLAHALTEKWSLIQVARQSVETLESTVAVRTHALEESNRLLEAEIVEHRAAAEQVREQAMFIEKAHDAIVVRDMDGKITLWNHGAERLYGWTAAETLGQSVIEVLYQGNPGQDAIEARKLVLEQGSWSGVMSQKTKDGRTVTTECHWTLLLDDQGRPKLVLGINTDITEKKEIQAQLLRAQRMESIGVLAGGIAHDLNNILAPILLGCDLLTPDSEEDNGTVSILRESAKRAADLVQQILSFARGMEGTLTEVDVERLIKDMTKIARETFPKDIEITTEIAPEIWKLVADPTQLHQILLNLCVNARDAMPDGGALTIRVGNLELDAHSAAMRANVTPGCYVMLSVEDTGTGISEEIKERIFDPFFTTKELGKGTGLGLSTTFGIVKSHRGFIEVDSEIGKGTIFRVCLPVRTGAPAAAENEAEPSLPHGNGELVLLVDDEDSIREISKRTLEVFGYRVLVARDGLEALGKFMLNQDEIAVVLTDMMMPNLDGLSLITALKALKHDVRIIAASGAKTETQRAKAAAAGAADFLTKPYSAAAVLGALNKLLHAPQPAVTGA